MAIVRESSSTGDVSDGAAAGSTDGGHTTAFSGRSASLVRRSITGVVFCIGGLTFVFGFGNGLALGLRLGVPKEIAGLVSPAVDLSVSALLVAIQFVRAQGVTDTLAGARLLLVLCGGMTLAINTLQPILMHELGRAAFDGVPPVLLLCWSEVAPSLLTVLHHAGRTTQYEQRTVPDEKVPSSELVAAARKLDAAHREAVRRPITRDKLRAELHTSTAIASELVRMVRAEPKSGDAP